jgi:hypothetical protein
MRTVGRAHPISTGLAALQPGFFHQPSHAVAIYLLALLVQSDRHTRASIRAAGALVHAGDLRFYRLGLPRTRRSLRALPLVIPATRDLQHLAHRFDWMFAVHRFNPGIPLCDGSERMPAAFFSYDR